MICCVKMMIFSKALRVLVVAVAMLIAAPPGAFADELDDAKAAGLVGETWRGYLAPVNAPTPEVTALVERINAARRQRYEEIARDTGASREDVELLTAQRVIDQAASGTYILDQSNNWRQK